MALIKRKPTPKKERSHIRKKQFDHCNLCPRFLNPTEFHIDHIIPLFKGGNNDLINKQALCITCHNKKTRKEISSRMSGSIRTTKEERELLGLPKWIPKTM